MQISASKMLDCMVDKANELQLVEGYAGKCFGTGRRIVDPTSIIDIDETTALCKIKMLSRCCGEAPEFLPLPRTRTYQQDNYNSCLLRGPVLPQDSSLKTGNILVRELAGVMVLITAHLKGDYSFGYKAMLQLLCRSVLSKDNLSGGYVDPPCAVQVWSPISRW